MTSSNGNIFRVTGLCAGNSPVSGEFPAQRPVTRSFDVFFDLCLNKPLGKQSWGWWFETPSHRLWRHCNGPSLFAHRWFMSHVRQQSQSHQTQLARVPGQLHKVSLLQRNDVIKWKHFPRYWPFVRGIHQSPVNSPLQRQVTRSFDVFFDLRLNKRLSKQWWGWWFETPSWSLWRHCNGARFSIRWDVLSWDLLKSLSHAIDSSKYRIAFDEKWAGRGPMGGGNLYFGRGVPERKIGGKSGGGRKEKMGGGRGVGGPASHHHHHHHHPKRFIEFLLL